MITIKQTLSEASEKLQAVSDTPELEAEVLLANTLKQPRVYLSAHIDQPLTLLTLSQFNNLLTRRLEHEPIAYITKGREFYGYYFIVNPAVLIPRPETEQLVNASLDWIFSVLTQSLDDMIRVVDVGTGSGNILLSLILTLKKRGVDLRSFEFVATDISSEALSVAFENAKRYQLSDSIRFLQGDLLTPLTGERYDLIMANLPYVPDSQWETLAPDVKNYEPKSAIVARNNGQALNLQLLNTSAHYLKPHGLLVYEALGGTLQQRAFETL